MPSQLVISRRIYVPALIVAALLIVLVLGSSLVRAQGLCEYISYTNVCVRPFGIMRVVANPADCTDREVPGALVNQQKFECILGAMMGDFQDALDDEAAARTAADADLEARIEALEQQLGP